MGEQYVGIDLHRRRSVIVPMTGEGEVLETVRVDNDPVALSRELSKAGPDPGVVLEATYGWYWAADLLQACGARVHLAHPLGSRCSATSGPETDARDSKEPGRAAAHGSAAEGLAGPTRGPGAARAGPLAGQAGGAGQRPQGPGPRRAGQAGGAGADERPVRGGWHPAVGSAAAGRAYGLRVASLRSLIGAYDQAITTLQREVAAALAGDVGYLAIQAIPGVGPVLAAVFVAEIGDVHRFAGAPSCAPGPG
jgi:transposase